MRWTRRQEAETALEQAQEERAEVRSDGARRERLVRRLEKHAEVNHFAERVERALRQRRASH